VSLECSHCGDVAIDHEDNVYTDSEGDQCASCGFPGHVVVDWEPGYDDEATAYWSLSDRSDAVCSHASCEECAPFRSQWPALEE
jgi:hypothetical protein